MYEQPKVLFKHQAFLIAHGRDSSVTWSTYEKFNSISTDSLQFPTVITDEFDLNDDGTADGLQLDLEFENSEAIQSVQLLLVFTYQLKVC